MTPAHSAEPLKVFVSAGFEGNTWMDASLNLLRAIAKTSAYKDRVTLDVASRRLTLEVPDDELGRRRAAWKPREPVYARGFGALYARHVTQADKGCDFDFLEGTAETPEPAIH